MPQGTLLAAQLLRATDYVVITGLLDQTKINIRQNDDGGELDPYGQDLVRSSLIVCEYLTKYTQRGNPIGGLMFSTQFSSGDGPSQIIDWTK
jgi:hypothetical protein